MGTVREGVKTVFDSDATIDTNGGGRTDPGILVFTLEVCRTLNPPRIYRMEPDGKMREYRNGRPVITPNEAEEMDFPFPPEDENQISCG